MRSSMLILYVLLASMLTACQHTGNVHGMNDMMEVEEYRPCDHVSMYSGYRFGDNALDFKLGKSSTAQGRQETLHLSLGVSGLYTTLNFPTLSNKVIKYGSYNNNEALGLLENEEYMNALWQALLSDEGHDQIKHVYVAIDLLNNSSQYIDQAAQKEAALVLETLVMLLRPSLRDTFIEYLEAVSEEKSWLSAAAMHAFFFDGGSPRISAEDRQYKFGDNISYSIDAYPRFNHKTGKYLIVKHKNESFYIKKSLSNNDQEWINEQQKKDYYHWLLKDLRAGQCNEASQGNRCVVNSDHPIAQDLIHNTSLALHTSKQRRAAAALELMIGLAQQAGKISDVTALVNQLKNVGYTRYEYEGLNFIPQMLQDKFSREYYQAYSWQLQEAERWEQELNEYSEEDESEE